MANAAEEEEPPMSIVFLENHSYSHVLFNEVKQSYTPGIDQICQYTLSKHIVQRPKDWVGIFKVGWTTPRDYFTFVWAPAPSSTDSTSPQQVLFKAYYLPKDEEEYYQFVYVDHDGAVRGASSPFRFYVEAENDMVIVPSPDVLEDLQEQSERLLAENEQLKETSALLSKEHTEAQALLKTTQDTLKVLEKEKVDLQSQNEDLRSQMESLQSQNADLQSQNKGLQRQNMDLQSQVADLVPSSMLEAARTDLASAKDEIEKIADLKQDFLKRIDSLVSREQRLEQRLEQKVKAHKEEEGALSEKYRSCEMERNQLREQIQKIKTNRDQMENDLRLTLDRIAILQTEKTDMKQEMEKMRDNSEAKARYLETLVQEKEQMQRAVAMQTEHGQQLEDQLRRAHQNLEVERKKEAAAQQQLTRRTQEVTDLSGKVQNLHKLLKIREKERDDVAQENQRLKQGRQSSLTQSSSLTHQEEQHVDRAGNAGLMYGNPYNNAVTCLPDREDTVSCAFCDEEIPKDMLEVHLHTEHTLKCPTCPASYSILERQVYDDHLFCHTVEQVEDGY